MSDITPADALRELGDDQAEYAAAAAKKLGLPESVELNRLRGSDLVLREQVAKQGAEIERLRAAINEYDPADHLHEILDIDPTDPVNARAHRLAHERMMGEWHDRVVGRDKVISEVKAALTQGITTDKAARVAAIRLIDDWLSRDLDAPAEATP